MLFSRGDVPDRDFPKVSIIIPTHGGEEPGLNGWPHIVNAYENICGQDYPNIEMVFIEDRKSPESQQVSIRILRELKRRDDRVKFLVLDENGGPSNARNLGVKLCAGEFVSFMDVDDESHETRTRVQVARLRQFPNDRYVVAFSDVNYYDVARKRPWGRSWFCERTIDQLTVTGQCLPLAGTIMMRRHEFLALGGFNSALRRGEDYDLALRILLDNNGRYVLAGKKPMLTYNYEAKKYLDEVQSLRVLVKKYGPRIFEKYGMKVHAKFCEKWDVQIQAALQDTPAEPNWIHHPRMEGWRTLLRAGAVRCKQFVFG